MLGKGDCRRDDPGRDMVEGSDVHVTEGDRCDLIPVEQDRSDQ